ncbi:MAG: dienelactone hydrolase family protein [Polyangiaceae bacterium]
MCDEDTEAENEVYLQQRLSRRDVSMGAGAVVASALLPGCTPQPAATQPSAPPPAPTPTQPPVPTAREPQTAQAPAPATTSRMVTVDTPDGKAEAFFVAPTEGRHPGVIVWPDVAGLRKAYMTMATRLAEKGYAVLAVNHYYRSSKLPVLETFAEWRTEEGKAKIAPMREALTAQAIAKDGAAFVAWIDKQKEVDTSKKLATTGYCMGGPYTFRTAAAAPDRVGVVASFHGGGLVTKEADSPHTLLAKTKAAALICIAQNDDTRSPEDKTTLRQALDKAKIEAEIEVYPAQHGWCTIDSPVYDQAQAERAWSRMLATFEKHL